MAAAAGVADIAAATRSRISGKIFAILRRKSLYNQRLPFVLNSCTHKKHNQ
jgi:hypothetical protein